MPAAFTTTKYTTKGKTLSATKLSLLASINLLTTAPCTTAGCSLISSNTMKKAIYYSIFFMAFALYLQAQSNKYYEKTIAWGAGQSGHSVSFKNDTSLVIACGGIMTLSEPEKVFLLFTNEYAENETILTYGSDTLGNFVFQAMITTPFGYAVGGWFSDTFGSSISHAFLMELDHSGTLLNFYDLRNEPYESNVKTILYYPETNTYYLGGNEFTTYPTKRLLIKMTDGEVVWRKQYAGYNNLNLITDLLPSPDGGCYAVGAVDSNEFEQTGNHILMKIDTAGNVVWYKIYNVGLQNGCLDFLRTENGNFVMLGAVNSYFSNLLRVDSTGTTVLLDRDYDFNNSQRTVLLKIQQVGNDFVAIGSVIVGGEAKGCITKVRGSDGEPLWVRYYEMGAQHDYFYNFTIAPDGGFVCVGRSEPVGGAGVYVVRTNCMGLLTLPQANFSYAVQDTAQGGRVSFINQSQYVYPDSIDGGHYIWDFGDGSPPQVSNSAATVQHYYAQSGIYQVSLWGIVCSDTSLYTQAVCVNTTPQVQAQFTYEQYPGQGWVQFQNQSTDLQGISYTWHFGDGDSSNLASPLHYYAADSLYTATLTVSICGFQSVVQQSILLAGLGADTPKPKTTQTIQVSPNPAQYQLGVRYHLPTDQPNATFYLYDLTGKQVHSCNLSNNNGLLNLDISQYASGIYYYQVQCNGQSIAKDKIAIIGKH
jgi:PKD repeat protein